MLLKYYGKKITSDGLRKKLKVDETGTYAPQPGLFLIKECYEVEMVTSHPKLFTKKDEGLNKDGVLERLSQLYENFLLGGIGK
jgi:hypothetical protein